ncbi:uncharacterized protein LOC133224740 [Neopsephotus bourkii]|uniref:uncharacterized protein LOC133224740 n=1 Tax=Neopsephotus bourkii TaxID=309878 RepID=UPI002AA54F47|nr:uncharacterized protein LOC133224740 [Neopsephotus bourkii]
MQQRRELTNTKLTPHQQPPAKALWADPTCKAPLTTPRLLSLAQQRQLNGTHPASPGSRGGLLPVRLSLPGALLLLEEVVAVEEVVAAVVAMAAPAGELLGALLGDRDALSITGATRGRGEGGKKGGEVPPAGRAPPGEPEDGADAAAWSWKGGWERSAEISLTLDAPSATELNYYEYQPAHYLPIVCAENMTAMKGKTLQAIILLNTRKEMQ